MKERIDIILERGKDNGTLSSFEGSFLLSLQNQFKRKPELKLSSKQVNWFQKIEAKVLSYNPEEWNKSWDEEKERNLKIATNYYSNLGYYFQDLIQWVEDNPTKIISKQNYQRLVENKYVKKIVNALNSEPAYENGAAVTVRSNNTIPSEFYKHKNKLFFVVSALNEAESPARGSRLYLILSSESAETFKIEERWIKKAKKSLTTKKQ